MPKRSVRNNVPVTESAPLPSDEPNQAASFGVRLIPADVAVGTTYWRTVSVRHLTADENRGKHNVYVDAVDETGQRVKDPALHIGWTWEGRRPDEEAPPRALDKPDNEPAGTVDLFQGQRAEIWIQGDGLSSDHIQNLHTDHDLIEKTSDGQDGNTRFHHSFHVIFQRTRQVEPSTNGGGASPPGDEEDENGGGGLAGERKVRWIGVVIASELNLRSGPGVDFARLDGLAQGTEVQVLEQFGEWLCIRVAGQLGYVHGSYVLWLRPGEEEPAAVAVLRPEKTLVVAADAGFIEPQVARTWNRYGGLLLGEAHRLGIDPAAAVATLVVESKGEPFGSDGRMTIRFENHIFYRYWGKENAARFADHFVVDPTTAWEGHRWRPSPNDPWLAFHGNQAAEWQVFEFARSLDERAAMLSISMGAPQIMGFNHAAIGYANVQAMFSAFQTDVRNQITSLFRFMEVNGLVDAVRQGDYTSFARVYNGEGREQAYAAEIARYAAAFRRLAAATGVPGITEAWSVEGVEGVEGVLPFVPMPTSPVAGKPLIEVDPELYRAWSKHIQQGFANNQTMFSRVLKGFLDPYWSTVWMYRIIFGVGIAAFVVAIFLAVTGANAVATVLFGGMTVAAFLTFFINRPLQALEENLMFITWLGVIYNTYWMRLVYAQNLETFQQDVEQATNDALDKVKELIDKHAERSGRRPDVR